MSRRQRLLLLPRWREPSLELAERAADWNAGMSQVWACEDCSRSCDREGCVAYRLPAEYYAVPGAPWAISPAVRVLPGWPVSGR